MKTEKEYGEVTTYAKFLLGNEFITAIDHDSAIEQIDSVIEGLNHSQHELTKLRLKSITEKVGDKVRVIDKNGKETICYIGAIYDRASEVVYSFRKVKKDGTMSSRTLWIYLPNIVTIIVL